METEIRSCNVELAVLTLQTLYLLKNKKLKQQQQQQPQLTNLITNTNRDDVIGITTSTFVACIHFVSENKLLRYDHNLIQLE